MIIPRKRVKVDLEFFDGAEFNSEKYKYLLEIAQSFATYWRTGYHEDFGRDKPVNYPSIVKDAGLCHVHILLGDISQRAQDLWDKNNIPNKGPFFRSHILECDSMLLYAVSEEGTALLLALYAKNAHELLSSNLEYNRKLASIAIRAFKEFEEQPALKSDLIDLLRAPTLYNNTAM